MAVKDASFHGTSECRARPCRKRTEVLAGQTSKVNLGLSDVVDKASPSAKQSS